MNFDKIKEFPVVIYNNLEEYNKVLSKARVRIFYKGHNRNGTYITDEYLNDLKDKSLDSMLKIVLNSKLEYVREKSMMVSELSLELLEELENESKE